MLNLEPATRVLAGLVRGVRDEQLTAPTPSAGRSVGDLLDHVDGLALAFTLAAKKAVPAGGTPGPTADASQLTPDWRVRIPERLATLGSAWNDPAAWEGRTAAGGVELSGDEAGLVTLDEVVVHGWELAVSTGQEFTGEPRLLEATHEFLQASVAESPQGTPGLFGPPVSVADDAPLIDRLIGLTGRDPSWRPEASGR